jgi:ribosomal protein L24E
LITAVMVTGTVASAPAPLGPMRQASAGTPLPGAPACPMLPSDNAWNADISTLPVHSRSSQWLASTAASTTRLHPDFGSSDDPAQPYGIPITIVRGDHAKRTFTFDYPSESDPGPYPFGPDIAIEAGSDRHALVIDSDACKLYELFAMNGTSAGSGAVFDLRSNGLRPDTWTSADAAGLPIAPGLLRYDEVAAGSVTHAIRFTVQRTDRSYVWPARHQAGARSDPALAPMGARFRLRGDFDVTKYRADTQAVLRAMQRYGLILADNGSNWFFTGAASNSWPDPFISELKTIPASAFDAVDATSLQLDANSGQVRPAVTGPPTPPAPSTGAGYLLADTSGRAYGFGGVHAGGVQLHSDTTDVELTPSGSGYWTVAADGVVTAIGDAGVLGAAPARRAGERVNSLSRTPTGKGYWLFTSLGRAFPYGDATFLGDMSAVTLSGPVLDSIPTPTGRGYYMVASDGGVFAFGDARFAGSMGGRFLARPVRSLVPDPDGSGYWLVASDGGVFAFDAPFRGSMGSVRLNAPVVGMVASGSGYLMVASDGGVFNFSNPFYGSLGGKTIPDPIVAVANFTG